MLIFCLVTPFCNVRGLSLNESSMYRFCHKSPHKSIVHVLGENPFLYYFDYHGLDFMLIFVTSLLFAAVAAIGSLKEPSLTKKMRRDPSAEEEKPKDKPKRKSKSTGK